MSHRYGRHGPRAWKRLQERKYAYHSTDLVPVVPREVVVHVHLPPIHAERIILIVVPPADPYKENSENPQGDNGQQQESNQSLPFPESRQIGPSQDERSSIYAELEQRATLAAERQAQADINAYKYHQQELPTKDRVRDIALLAANETITVDLLQRGNIDRASLRQHYVRVYLQVYDAYLQEAGMGGLIVSEEERNTQQQARYDAAQDKSVGLYLSEVELTCQAAIRAQERLKLATHAGSGYLTHVLKYLQVYEPAYRKERESGTVRSAPFLRAEQQPR
jgi:hypothetical protein